MTLPYHWETKEPHTTLAAAVRGLLQEAKMLIHFSNQRNRTTRQRRAGRLVCLSFVI